MRSWWKFLWILCIFISACHPGQYTFVLVETRSEDPSSYQNIAGKEKLESSVVYKGVESKDNQQSVVEFEMELKNEGTGVISIDPQEYVLMDDDNHRFYPQAGLKTRQLWPKTSSKIMLTFVLPPGYMFSKTGSFRVLWHYKYENRLYRRVSKFVKQEIRYRKVYTPCWDIDGWCPYCNSWHWHGNGHWHGTWPGYWSPWFHIRIH